VPYGIENYERAHHHVARAGRPGPDAPFHRAARTERLADRRPGAGAHRSFGNRRRRGGAGAVGIVGTRPAVRLRSRRQVEVEDHGGRDDRDHSRRPDGEAAASLLEPAHHAVRRAQAVRRAAGEQHRVDVAHQMARVEGVELARTAGAAASGAEALDRQAAEQPQVMLSDIRMPNMTGVELVPKALAQDSDLAVIMLTAIDEPRTAIECMKLGAYDYLIKPVDLDELEMSL